MKVILKWNVDLMDCRIQKGGEETGLSAVKGCLDEGVL